MKRQLTDKPKKHNGWYLLSERQPKEDQVCLVLTENGCICDSIYEIRGLYDPHGQFEVQDTYGIISPVKYWRPLPRLPEEYK